MPYDELQPFMGILSVTNGIGARALEIAILTASRTFEVLGATWEEFDLDKRVWTVPQERMKAGIEHRIPLSESAMKILKVLHDGRISDSVFPNLTNGKPLSNAGMSSVLKRMGRTDITVHGFRSTFRDWVAEKTNTLKHYCVDVVSPPTSSTSTTVASSESIFRSVNCIHCSPINRW